MKSENISKFFIEIGCTAAIAFIPAFAQTVNPLYAVLIKVSDFALERILSSRPDLKFPLTHAKYKNNVFHANNWVVKNAIIIGVSVTALGLPGAAVAFLASNIGTSLAHRIKLLNYRYSNFV